MESTQLVNLSDYAMGKDAMLTQVRVIQETLTSVMKEGEHYGKIPGCGDKPTLLKPGAEKIGATFHLAPSYEIKALDLPNGHREYQIVCTLTHIITGAIVGEGVGACSTMETKYRFRVETVDTGEHIPGDYKENKGAYRAKGFVAKKDNASGQWSWCKTARVEHDNPADYYNTCLKMAKKRAHVDAILTATAASDIFTQDVEDMKDIINGEYTDVPPAEKTQPAPTTDEMKAEMAKWFEDTFHETAGEEFSKLTKGTSKNPLTMKNENNIKAAYTRFLELKEAASANAS